MASILRMMMLLLLKSPVFLGWAKPVALNYRKLKSPRKDIPLVCLAVDLSSVYYSFFLGLEVCVL
jgi:Zn-dependent protease